MDSRSFVAVAESVPAARAFAAGVLAHLPAVAQQIAAVLISELATNAVMHGAGTFEVSIGYDEAAGCLRVEVSDGGAGEPRPQHPDATSEHGRGLQLVEALATDWGVRRLDGSGKAVWSR